MASWEEHTEEQFKAMIEKVPVFMRSIAQEKVSKKAQELANQDRCTAITQKHMVDAFFAATPFGFHGPMKSDMESLGIDYTKYGHQK